MTKEERALLRAYVNMAKAKGWNMPSEYEVSKILEIEMTYENRDKVEKLISKQWEKYNI